MGLSRMTFKEEVASGSLAGWHRASWPRMTLFDNTLNRRLPSAARTHIPTTHYAAMAAATRTTRLGGTRVPHPTRSNLICQN